MPQRFFRLQLLASFVLALGLIACGEKGTSARSTATPFPDGSTMAQIVERGELVVGVKHDLPLFGLQDALSGTVDGFDVAMAKEIARALGLRDDQVRFVETISADRIPFLEAETVDIVLSTMTINAERADQIEFSRPYFLTGQSILIRKSNSEIRGIEDLAGKNVCFARDSTSEENIAEQAPEAILHPLQTYSACVAAMKAGIIDAVSTDETILAGFAAADNSLKLVGGTFTREPYGVGVKKGRHDMAEFVTSVITEMLEDGRWERLYRQYLGSVDGLPPAFEAKAKLPFTP